AVQIDGTEIFVDTPYEILINKLCALLSRAEFRDLVDLEALIAKGLDWKGALRRAEEKDGGFSSATLGWVLKDMPVRALGRAAGADATAIERSTSFRDTLVHELASINRPPK
ncbi:MAG TPA: nucleotidyl transferase AbiEii/AbiGii toxin family protein, partial [Myxococcota bacterium]|nr:nucleotidyl transferase AbiEii/AbiGii toxin family protein [Myxococcota bacterium]